jgi:hypothetical protein
VEMWHVRVDLVIIRSSRRSCKREKDAGGLHSDANATNKLECMLRLSLSFVITGYYS